MHSLKHYSARAQILAKSPWKTKLTYSARAEILTKLHWKTKLAYSAEPKYQQNYLEKQN